MMIAHIDDEAELFTVLSRLSIRYAKLAGVSALPSSVPTFSGNGIALSSAFGSSCE
jgi:hypothetical protein